MPLILCVPFIATRQGEEDVEGAYIFQHGLQFHSFDAPIPRKYDIKFNDVDVAKQKIDLLWRIRDVVKYNPRIIKFIRD